MEKPDWMKEAEEIFDTFEDTLLFKLSAQELELHAKNLECPHCKSYYSRTSYNKHTKVCKDFMDTYEEKIIQEYLIVKDIGKVAYKLNLKSRKDFVVRCLIKNNYLDSMENDSLEFKIRKLCKDKEMTISQMALQLNVSYTTLFKVIHEKNIPLPKASQEYVDYIKIKDQKIIDLYHNGEKLSVPEIAKRLKYPARTIHATLKKYNLPNWRITLKENIELQKTIIDLYEKKLTQEQIAKKVGYETSSIRQVLIEHNVIKNRIRIDSVLEKKIIELHLKGMWNIEIAKELNIKTNNVLYTLKKNGYSAGFKGKSRAKMEEMEQKKIKVKELLTKGYNTTQICKELNASKKLVAEIKKELGMI